MLGKASCLPVVSFLVLIISTQSFGQSNSEVSSQDDRLSYKRRDIGDARFGTNQKESFAEKAHRVAEEINSSVYGQETAALVLQDRLVQYIEGFPHHSDEPVVLNLVGLPGIGKTAMLKKLEEMGLPAVFFNAQDYVPSKSNSRNFLDDFYRHSHEYLSGSEPHPLIVVLDELDKLPEISTDESEETHTLIGSLNSAISEGQILIPNRSNGINVSNVLFITTMNFSPKEMEEFTGEVLEEAKSFYDMTLEDFSDFDKWIRERPSARYKVLSRLFRSNTVSRLAPNTVMLQPLDESIYRKIIEFVVTEVKESIHQGPERAKYIELEVDESLIEFFLNETVYAPSGARETIFRAKALVDQLVSYGTKFIDPDDPDSIDQPRKIQLSVEEGRAVVTVTPVVSRNGIRHEKESFKFKVDYNSGARLFLPPSNMAIEKPRYPTHGLVPPSERPVTKREIRENRFSELANIPKSVSENINSSLLGQEETVDLVIDDLRKYLGRVGPAKGEPSARILSGFPGIGKSELVRQMGTELGLPVVKINMQQFSSDAPQTVRDFVEVLRHGILKAKSESKDGRFILLLEELDKVFEVNPQTGAVVNRPIMALIKDLLNDGQIKTRSENFGIYDVDIRSAFTFATMNFSVDRFGFSADPRLTSVEDVMGAWKRLNGTQMALKQLLSTMFLPETVSRILSRFTVMKPLSEDEYRALIEIQVNKVLDSRTLDEHGRNVGKIEVELTDKYKEYLYNETVIPSEGARHTVVSVQSKISSDLEAVFQNLPRRSDYSTAPLRVVLDFDGDDIEVVASIQRVNVDPESESREILRRQVALQFPSPRLDGPIEAMRMLVSAHEFGHAFMAARLGMRFAHVVVVPPAPGIGGYVRYSGNSFTAKSQVHRLYSALASRALERIVMSDNPTDPMSLLSITAGSSSDIQQATYTLYNLIYELGLDPKGGTIDSNFNLGFGRYASIQSMPEGLTEKLGLILRDMENLVVKDFLITHNKEWYAEKIVLLARKGVMTEEEFFDLIGYNFIGDAEGSEEIVSSQFLELFGEHLTPKARNTSEGLGQSLTGQPVSPKQLREDYLVEFAEIVKKHLHGREPGSECESALKARIGFTG